MSELHPGHESGDVPAKPAEGDAPGATGASPSVGGRLRVIGVRLGEQALLAPVGSLETVLAPPEVARVPHTAKWLRGIASWRGQALPVIDLGCFAWGRHSESGTQTRVLVVAGAASPCGFLVDEVFGLREIEHERVGEVDSAVRDACGELGDWLTASVADEDKRFALLPLEAFANITDFADLVEQSKGDP